MLHEVLSAREIPDTDPRWKIREALTRFIEEHFASLFYVVEDLHWGYFTFVIRSNPVIGLMINKINQNALQNKLNHFLTHEKIALDKVSYQFLPSDDPEAPKDDQILRFDIY